jgi:hypothetical protein
MTFISGLVDLIELYLEASCLHKLPILRRAEVAPVHLDSMEVLFTALVLACTHGDQHDTSSRQKRGERLQQAGVKVAGVWKMA